MFLCSDFSYRPIDDRATVTYRRESENPVEYRLFIANQTLHILFDDPHTWRGRIFRPADGLEAFFSNRVCLEHLIEGLVGRRVWPQYRKQVLTIFEQFQVN